MGRTKTGDRRKPLAKKGLTDKQRMFVAEYVTNGYNGTKAAIAAGYPQKTAQVMGSKLLKNSLVAAALKKIMGNTLKKKGLEREAILERVSDNLHRDLNDLCDENGFVVSDLREIPKRTHAFIDGLDVTQSLDENGNPVSQRIKIKLSPNAAVQDMAMKYIGAYAPDKHELTHAIDWDSLATPINKPTPQEQKLIDIEAEASSLDEHPKHLLGVSPTPESYK